MPDPRAPRLTVSLEADRSLVWTQGDSVRYLVANIGVEGTVPEADEETPLNIALAIDVSGSMSGRKLEAAQQTAIEVANALNFRDRLTVVSFASDVQLHLDARPMTAEGRESAVRAIRHLQAGGGTSLYGGWKMARDAVFAAMQRYDNSSHRVLLLTDGQANAGLVDPIELAHQAGESQRQGILTSAVGIGDYYEEALLAAMTESGGGALHDASNAEEISEVVLGELTSGRRAMAEHATLRLNTAAGTRAEVVGAWSHTIHDGGAKVLVGSLHPDTTRSVVIRIFCPAGSTGETLPFSASVSAKLPDGTGEISSGTEEATLRFAEGDANSAQRRNERVSLTALLAWQSDTLRRAIQMNQQGNYTGAQNYVNAEDRWIRQYAGGLSGAELFLGELEMLSARIGYVMEERTRKDVYVASTKRSRYERDHRIVDRKRISEMLNRDPL